MHSAESIQRNVAATRDTRADRIEALLSRCAQHDEHALEELYQLVAPQLFGMMMSILKRTPLAEEALQDVMIRVWQHAGQYVAYRGRAWAWLVSIARYRAIDLLRAQRESVTLDEVPPEMLTDSSAEDLSDTTTTERIRQTLQDCLARLSPDQRRCVALAYVEGCSHAEIAEKVGRPSPTVRSWMRRGLASLKRCLDA